MVMDDARTEPQIRVGGGWISGLVLANLGLYMAFLTSIQVLLAEQIDAVDLSGKEIALGWATGVGALVAVVANLLLMFWHTWPVATVAALLLGLGFGAYIAVDQALITQVLPRAGDRAKDLGVINVANSAPQVLGPALAAPVVAYAGGYAGLYLTSTLVTVLGGVLVWRIRSVP
jgi:MFS family permease